MCNNSSMQNQPGHGSARVSSVAQALRVLDALRAHGPLGVTEIAERVGVAPSTAHRLLGTLMDAHYVRQPRPGAKYEVGPMVQGSVEGAAIDHCVEVALPHMEALRGRSGETIHLVQLQRRNVKFIAAIESTQPMRVTNRAGRLLPAHATAAGKLLLSLQPDDAVANLFPTGLPGLTHETITKRSILQRELVTIRRAGYARNMSEAEVGVAALAVPVHRPSGTVSCALTLTGPQARFSITGHSHQTREEDFLVLLKDSAAAIEADLEF